MKIETTTAANVSVNRTGAAPYEAPYIVRWDVPPHDVVCIDGSRATLPGYRATSRMTAKEVVFVFGEAALAADWDE